MGGNYCFIDGNLAFTRQCCTTVPSVGDTVTGFMIECDQGQRWKYRALSVSPANSKASTNQSAVNSKQTRYAWYYCFVWPSLNVGLPAWCPQVVWCHLLHSQMSPFWENVTQKGNNCERNTIEGRISHFLPWWLRAGRQSVISQGKIAWSTSPQLGIEPTPWENRPRDTFILPLSFHPPGPRRGQTVRCISFPAELSWPGPRQRQTVRYIHSPTELSWPGPWWGQWDTFILPLSYHNPGHREDRQWDTFILPLSYHDPGPRRRQTVRYIHSPTELSWGGQAVRYICCVWSIVTCRINRNFVFIEGDTNFGDVPSGESRSSTIFIRLVHTPSLAHMYVELSPPDHGYRVNPLLG